MKNFIYFLGVLIFMVSCQEDNLDIPRDANGNAVLTDVSSTTTTGISTLDNAFTVTATLPNAKVGDVMTVECLQLQLYPEGGNNQLLPLAGTQKTVTVASDKTVSVSYNRTEAKLNNPGNYVTVTFAGATDHAKQKVEMVYASKTTKPKVGTREVDVARTAETAYFNVNVEPKSGAYTGTLIAKRKNGTNDAWIDVPGSPFSGTQPFLVPISGTDFAAGKDTMFYKFSAASGTYTDEINSTIIVREPYFFLKKSATVTLGGAAAGRNLLINAAVAENNVMANIAVSGSLILKGGSGFLAAGKTIEFVPSTLAMYEANNSNNTIDAFNAGVKSATADPILGQGVYIFKMVNGAAPSDVYYGLLKVTSVLPGVSVSFEYRIGNQYAHLLVIK